MNRLTASPGLWRTSNVKLVLRGKLQQHDDDTACCGVTNVRRLSRYYFEDVLRLQVDANIIIYFELNSLGKNL